MGRVKRWSVGATAAGVGLAWALVSQNVVGATNAAGAAGTAGANGAQPAPSLGTTPHQAEIPSSDFFGPAGAQPQPLVGSGGTGGGGGSLGRPIVRGGTS